MSYTGVAELSKLYDRARDVAHEIAKLTHLSYDDLVQVMSLHEELQQIRLAVHRWQKDEPDGC